MQRSSRILCKTSKLKLSFVRCCAAGVNKFNLKQIAPSPDAFVGRHIGPSEEEQREMLKSMGLEVTSCLGVTVY